MDMMIPGKVKFVLLFSGKRKCGKDFIAQKLFERIKDRSQIIRISAPIKSEWANRFNLNLDELLSDGPFKEKYRKDMIEWSDTIRSKDYGYFCREALKEVSAQCEIILVSDIRRKTDVKYFREVCGSKVKLIRIKCSDEIRSSRGWKYEIGIDDVASECDLDDFNEWDLEVTNEDVDSESIVNEIITRLNI